MILQSLVEYYEAMAEKGKAACPGWGSVEVSYALELREDGTLSRVIPLLSPSPDGKKMLPRKMELPAPVKRTNGTESNFLWDNSSYIFGFDGKGNPKRAKQCFEAAKKRHLEILDGVGDPFAAAVRSFFNGWDVETAEECPELQEYLDDIKKGANLTFRYEGEYPGENASLRRAWQAHYDQEAEGEQMICLVTGEKTVPVPTHPAIKGVQGAQTSGAALVSFNDSAFCSYDREQNLNAPVSKYAAFAYTTALNALLAEKEHTRHFGDTTVVFWTRDAEPAYQDLFANILDGEGEKVSDTTLRACVDDIAHGRMADWSSIPIKPENSFYVLGLAPNAARLSVRFFLRSSFGDFVKNVKRHYDDIEITGGERSKFETIPLWLLLRETVNQKATNKEASPQMAGDTLRAILSGGRYPSTLYDQTLMRVRAEQDVTGGKAGIIKAYLLRNANNDLYREAATVALNEDCRETPYILGRMFSLMENIQESSTGASTIKDGYFNSASSTPAVVFPLLLKLKNSHMKVLMREKPGLAVTLDKQMTELMDMLPCTFPKHLLLPEQGEFMLGYYHQMQRRYEKKDKAVSADNDKEVK